MTWPRIFLLLISALIGGFSTNALALEDTLVLEEKTLNVEVEGRKVFSKECEFPRSCFSFPDELEVRPAQSPLFTLCLQSGGSPGFGKLKKSKKKIEFCVNKDGVGAELNTLMNAFNKAEPEAVGEPIEKAPSDKATEDKRPGETKEEKAVEDVDVRIRSAMDKMRKQKSSAPNDFLKTGGEKKK